LACDSASVGERIPKLRKKESSSGIQCSRRTHSAWTLQIIEIRDRTRI